jgi:dTDP-4-amino-4,6-dideoxygalactose transaminase
VRLGILSGEKGRATPLPIVRPRFPKLAEFAEEFDRALATGPVTNQGPHAVAFEAELSDYLGVPTLVFSSGQAALMAMLGASGLTCKEVIVPSFTFCATPHAVVWAGAKPVFADVDPVTLTLDPEDVERRITANTAAILGVCVYGIACDYAALADVANRHGLKLFYDSAPAFGTRVDGRPIGHFGDGQIFSFHATKAFCTMEGGAFSTADGELFARAEALRNFGQRNGRAWGAAGFNGKMPEVAAMIGRRQLRTFEEARQRRLYVARRYREGLQDLPGLTMATPPANQEPIWLYFPIRLDPAAFGLSRDEATAALAADNILCRKYFDQPCHEMPAYQGGTPYPLPVTDLWASATIALPVYNDQTDEEIDYIVERIRAIHVQAREVRAALVGVEA